MNRGNVLLILRQRAAALAPFCKNGHPRKPYTPCKACRREWQRDYKRRHPRHKKGRERVGVVAIQQALFFKFNCSIRQVATIMGMSYCTAYSNIWRVRFGYGTVLSWNVRRRQQEAIAKARELLGGQS